MKVKIFSIGDELLIGQVVDTNAAWIAAALSERGIQTVKKLTLPDDETAIMQALDEERRDVDAIFITGGLGPTRDDKTKDVLTRYFNDHLVLHSETLQKIESFFATINQPVTKDNHDQAMVPSGCRVLPNDFGTAPGMLFSDKEQLFISMPGVPVEMRQIMTNEVLPLLDSISMEEFIGSRTFITVNIPESILSARLAAFEDELPEALKLAYLPHFNLVRLRLNASTRSETDSEHLLDKYEQLLKEELGPEIIWSGDLRMEQIVGKLLKATGKTITLAESCTGGFVSHRLTSVPGSSAYFPGSIVTYSYEIKTTRLQVDKELLWEAGAVSEPVVRKMAHSARLKFQADYAIAISGIAGPGGGTPDKPVGTVWMAVQGPNSTVTHCFHFHGDRPQIVERSCISSLNMLREMLLEDHPGIMEKANPRPLWP